MAQVSIIDYGVGNIPAFTHIYRRLNIDVAIARTAEDVAAAERLVLPGVGSFDWAMSKLDRSGLRDTLDVAAFERRIPIIGVCVGMQMMARRSEEGRLDGLGWIQAEVRHFHSLRANSRLPLPHMGWNDVTLEQPHCPLVEGLERMRFYFLHSYCVVLDNAQDALATTTYSLPFTSAIHQNNIYATQFHPEKSHVAGMTLLKNFSRI